MARPLLSSLAVTRSLYAAWLREAGYVVVAQDGRVDAWDDAAWNIARRVGAPPATLTSSRLRSLAAAAIAAGPNGARLGEIVAQARPLRSGARPADQRHVVVLAPVVVDVAVARKALPAALSAVAHLLLTTDLSYKNIAGALGKSPGTIRKQVETLYARLRVHSRQELALTLRARGRSGPAHASDPFRAVASRRRSSSSSTDNAGGPLTRSEDEGKP